MSTSASLPRVRPTQAQRVAESRTRLLHAATRLFAEQGYEAATTGGIADLAGYARSMVNTRFGGKEGLLAAMLEDHWITELLVSRLGAETGLEALLRIVGRLGQFIVEEPVRLRAFLVVSFESAGPSSIPRERLLKPLADLDAAIAESLQDGLEDGSVAAHVNPRRESARIVNEGLGMAYRWVVAPEAYDFAYHVQVWHGELLDALAAGTRK